MRALVDTNVIIDALTGREPFREDAEKIFLLAANQMVELFISASAATDIYYLIRKHFHNTETAKNIMIKLYDLFFILGVNAEDCTDALLSKIEDYEDAVVSCCARRNKMEYIVTRNLKDYEKSEIPAILPLDFLNIVNGDNSI